jgi:predicted enzyme related to lactoylglutathione lyase
VAASAVRKTYFMMMVVDMNRALRFYAEGFGAAVSFTSPYWSEFSVAGATIALHAGGDGVETPTGLGFEVDDLDAAIAQAITVGGRVMSPARDRPAERIRLAELADSEGNVITVAEVTDG